MRNCLLIILVSGLLVVFGTDVYSQVYRPVDSLSTVRFVIRNVGMETDGRFTGLEGSIVFNPADLKTAVFSITINASTINTGIEPRDAALRGKDYLDTDAHSRISFTAKQVTAAGQPGNYLVKGIVSIKGISKEIAFPFQVNPNDDGWLFTGEMKLRRRDFNIGMSSIVLSEGISVFLSVYAKKAP